MVFRQSWFGWVRVHISNVVVNGPTFTGLFSLNAEVIAVDTFVFRFWISRSVTEIFVIKIWSCPKSCRVLHVFDPNFFRGGDFPKFLNLNYKIEHTSDHAAKFHGDWQRELGDLALKKGTAVKHKTAGYYRTGRPNNCYILCTSAEIKFIFCIAWRTTRCAMSKQ